MIFKLNDHFVDIIVYYLIYYIVRLFQYFVKESKNENGTVPRKPDR